MLPLHQTQYLVFIFDPFSELSDVVPYPLGIGVKEMRSVERDAYACFGVDFVVTVAAYVRSFFDDETGLRESGVLLGYDGAA